MQNKTQKELKMKSFFGNHKKWNLLIRINLLKEKLQNQKIKLMK